MSEPTESEIKRFWEWCGWDMTYHPPSSSLAVCEGYIYRDNEGNITWYDKKPKLDLNSLFRWAVPKLTSTIGKHKAYLLLSGCLSSAMLQDRKLEEEIFWAIYKVAFKEEQ